MATFISKAYGDEDGAFGVSHAVVRLDAADVERLLGYMDRFAAVKRDLPGLRSLLIGDSCCTWVTFDAFEVFDEDTAEEIDGGEFVGAEYRPTPDQVCDMDGETVCVFSDCVVWHAEPHNSCLDLATVTVWRHQLEALFSRVELAASHVEPIASHVAKPVQP